MVFEHLFPDALLERKHWTGFVLAFIYSTISIIIARLIFVDSSGLASVAFVSIFLIPYFSTLLKQEVNQELRENKFTFSRLLLDNKDIIKIYLFVFFGIYTSYLLFAIGAVLNGHDPGALFPEQLGVGGIRGGASLALWQFSEILLNNSLVLLACFFLAMIAGDGAIFFVAWNASAWGAIFGLREAYAYLAGHGSLLWMVALTEAITLPHTLLEGLSYVLAAIAGGVIADELDKPEEIRSFALYFLFAAIIAVVLKYLLDAIVGGIVGQLLWVCALLGLLAFVPYIFTGKHDRQVFWYNYKLFLLAIAIVVLAAAVEAFVLARSTTLDGIYDAAQSLGAI